MIPQSALILTSGLIFLFFSTPNIENLYITNSIFTMSLVILLTIAPCILLYIFGRFAISRYIKKYSFLIQNPSNYGLPFGIIALGGFILQIHYLQTPILVKKYFGFFGFENIRTLICVIPFIIAITLNRLAIYELTRLTSNDILSRNDFILPDLKLMLIPSIPFFASLLVSDIIDQSPLRVRIFFIKQYYIYWIIIMLIALTMFVKSGFFIRHIWKTERLPDGEIRSQIESLASLEKIKFKDILIWSIGNRSIANAGMAGLLPKSRYIFITDSLLLNFNINEIKAVVAHEFGHIKYNHILYYMIFSFGYLAFFSFLYAIFYPLIKDVQFNTIFSAIMGALITIFIFIIYFIFIFRYFSRRFERQSDLYSVKITGDPEAFKNALIKVVSINYIPVKINRFAEIFRTHPSISERLNLIDMAMLGDTKALKYINPIFNIRKATVILALVIFMLIFTKHDLLFPPGERHYEIGRQYAIEGLFDNAINEFSQAIINDPKSSSALYALGLMYAEKGSIDMAEIQFQKALELNPKNKTIKEKLDQIRKKRSEDAG